MYLLPHGDTISQHICSIYFPQEAVNEYVLTKKNGEVTGEGVESGVSDVLAGSAEGNGLVHAYDLGGRKVYTALYADFADKDILGSGVFVVRCGDRVRKVVK